MTYSPGGPGYPPAQQHGPYAPTTQFSKVDEGPSKLPVYLLGAVALLGLAVYLSSFGPMFTISNSEFPQLGGTSGTSIGIGLAVIAALLGALLAGVSLVPKQKDWTAVVAVLSVLGFLLVIAEVINKPSGVSIDWALYLVIVFTALQALAAVGALLLDAGVISPPTPRPKYDQYQPYGAPGQYYGQHPGQQHTPQGAQQNFGQQRPGYQQYGGYPSGPSSGGFPPSGQQGGPPTPPTGFPTYSQPPSPAAPTQAMPAQQQQDSSSTQSGPAPS